MGIEQQIRDRLASIDGVPGGVGAVAELSMQAVAGRRWPALFVGSMGLRVVDTKSPGAVVVASRWMVVVGVRQVGDVVGGSDARMAAEDLAWAVLATLYRWAPAGAGPLMPVDPPAPEYAAGTLLLPLAFECDHIIRRQA